MENNRINDALDMINVERMNAVVAHIRAGIGRKIFMLTPQFPFMFIGIIDDVIDDVVVLEVETTHFQQLENRRWVIHIDQIEVFFIERDDAPLIPELKDLDSENRG
ncbi:hypothetical protein [Bacillus sp. V59.32b]|uniref:hypothetical protein n=1 Tax=Bacillus sp. V59.32b TaxID=1758642 RepID=UPI0020B15288|nr:hypothetical protein [Bacillus sp. V59.32b]